MRVLLFGNSNWCLYNFRQNLVRELVARGHEVFVLAPEDTTYDEASYIAKLQKLGATHIAIPFRARGTNPLSELLVLFDLARILRRIRPDFVFTYTVKCNLYTGLCRYLQSFSQVANISGMGEVFEKKGAVYHIVCALYRIALRNVDRIFFQNPEDQAICEARGLVPKDRSEVIPGSGVDLRRYAPVFASADAGCCNFLMFGRLVPKKGYTHYLAAAEHLRAKYGDAVSFSILGIEDKNRAESRELLARIKELHAQGIVRYYEPLINVVPVVQQADVVTLPSTYNEGVPRSLLEAMACGNPIITTDWKGCRETVIPGENGLLVKPDDTESLIAAFEKMIQMNSDEMLSMAHAARRFVEERYDEQKVLAAYLAQLGEVLQTIDDEPQPVTRAA